MNKLTDLQSNDDYLKNNPPVSEYSYDGKHFKVKQYKDWECIEGNDYIVCLPHLIDRGEIVIRKEWIPTFLLKEPNKEFHLTVVTGGIDENETPEEALFRELEEEAGIKLNTHYSNYEKLGEYYTNKGNNGKCHIYYLPIEINDFQYITPTGDGSEAESKSSCVVVDTQYLDSLKMSEAIGQLCLMEFKNRINNL